MISRKKTGFDAAIINSAAARIDCGHPSSHAVALETRLAERQAGDATTAKHSTGSVAAKHSVGLIAAKYSVGSTAAKYIDDDRRDD